MSVQRLHLRTDQRRSTAARVWRALTNGELADVASRGGFSVLLTRDRAFGMAAGGALGTLPDLAIVIVMLPQAREAAYLSAMRSCGHTVPRAPRYTGDVNPDDLKARARRN